ncbi:hypothetical protein [Actinomadura miaoliensis]
MRELELSCSIDGRHYWPEHLARVQHDRHLHVLHEMKRLGAAIGYAGKLLSHDDINRLSAEDAREACIAARQSYDVDGIKTLYKEQLRTSDQMWKDANDAPDGAPMRAAFADLTVTGITIDEFRENATDGDAFHSNYARINPDHYFLYGHEAGMRAMETFGMYGGPSEVDVITDPDIKVPVERETGYRLLTAGYTTLAGDGTDINVLAYHQFKPLTSGLAVKLGAFFPPKTPKDLVDGHAVHMAIEFWETSKLLAAAD